MLEPLHKAQIIPSTYTARERVRSPPMCALVVSTLASYQLATMKPTAPAVGCKFDPGATQIFSSCRMFQSRARCLAVAFQAAVVWNRGLQGVLRMPSTAGHSTHLSSSGRGDTARLQHSGREESGGIEYD